MATNKTSLGPLTKPTQTFREKLLEYPMARNALEILQADGMKMDVLVAFLTVIAGVDRSESIYPLLPRPEDLKAMVARAQRLADQIAIFNSNPFLDPKRSLLMKVPEPYGSVFEWLPGALRIYTAYLGVQASLIGQIGKTKPKASKWLIILMLEHVKKATGRPHFDLVARLLTAADAAHGRRGVVEASTLEKRWKRHRKWMTNPQPLEKVLAKVAKTIPPGVHITEKKGPFGRFSRQGK